MDKTTALFLSGYDNVYNDSPYDQGYLDALCMLDNFLVFTEEQGKALNEAKKILKERLSE